MSWRPYLTEILTTGSYSTQAEIASTLAAEGHAVDQATISRELKAMGARKVGGAYRLPANGPGLPVHRMNVTAQGCLVVVVTDPAYAMALAQAMDDAGIPGVLGTVAGDDTVFVATTGQEGAERLARWLGFKLSR